ncbi:hypothetical protein BDC45DRAFT_521953 [Circinella umbellata]|nr:hypothetical protein BDC45DRAFT_521953 [Circinella umbellata]
MKFVSIALIAGASIAAASPAGHAEMLKKREPYSTETVIKPSTTYVNVYDGYVSTSTSWATVEATTTAVATEHSALFSLDIPLLSFLNNMPALAEIIEVLSPVSSAAMVAEEEFEDAAPPAQ